MEAPKNCRECSHTNYCTAAHYGGSICKYEEIINHKRIEGTFSNKAKD